MGPKGATIKRIQQQTHTYIITPSRDKEPIFEVTGLPDNVETARNEIELHIASRTGSFSPSFDSKDPSMVDDFHLNGTETAYGSGCGVETYGGGGDNAAAAALKNLPQTRSLNYLAASNGGAQQSYVGATSSMNALNSKVHFLL